MTLVRKKVTNVKWPVKITTPCDGGTWSVETFTGVFKKIGLNQIEKLADKGDLHLVKDVLKGWEDIKDEDGNDVAFTKKELDGFLNDINFIKGTVQAIIDMQKGAPEKNS